jgi:carbonic anhydrase
MVCDEYCTEWKAKSDKPASALPRAAANGGGPARLQSARLVAADAELGSLGALHAAIRSVLILELNKQPSPFINHGMKKSQIVCCFIVVSLLCGHRFARAADPAHPDQPIVSPAEAISRLKEGNGRFTAGNAEHPHESSDERKHMATNSYENAGMVFLGMTAEQAAKRRAELTKSQHPFATIVSCSDSRVPPEIVFDQGLGDLFVLRVAGNVINDESLGSIEYAVDHLAVRLIVVLGHQRCGAVKAAKETIAAKGKAPAHIQSLVNALRRAVEATMNADLEATVEANVKNVVQALRSSTPILKPKVDSGEVRVIGANYSLDSGSVSFLGEK